MKSTRTTRFGIVTLIGLAIAGIMPAAYADSDFQTGTGALTANTHLDFRIVIPKFLRFQVGSTGTTVDLVEFQVPAANVGNGTAVARTNGGTVPILLQGNAGNISLVGTTLGSMNTGPAPTQTISYSEITSSSDNTNLNAPTLVDGAASAAISITPNVGTQVVNRTANWTFAYKNTNYVAAGTYGGVNVNNGRVTYTATLP